MNQSVIEIDISILDKEIESLKAELQKKTALRDYIQSLAKKTPSSSTKSSTLPVKTNATAPAKTAPKKAVPVKATSKAATPAKTASTNRTSKSAAPSKPMGLTEFILDYLKKNPKSENKSVTDAYINASGNKSDGAKANVANTLSRLRRENKVKVQDGTGSGFLWSLK